MMNMLHCRFLNTVAALEECREALVQEEELSEAEAREKEKLLALCKELVLDFGDTSDL